MDYNPTISVNYTYLQLPAATNNYQQLPVTISAPTKAYQCLPVTNMVY